MTDPLRDFRLRMIERRKMLGMTQEEVANLIGVSKGTVANLESGFTRNPGWAVLVAWANSLRMEARAGIIVTCREYKEPYFVELTPKANGTRP